MAISKRQLKAPLLVFISVIVLACSPSNDNAIAVVPVASARVSSIARIVVASSKPVLQEDRSFFISSLDHATLRGPLIPETEATAWSSASGSNRPGKVCLSNGESSIPRQTPLCKAQ